MILMWIVNCGDCTVIQLIICLVLLAIVVYVESSSNINHAMNQHCPPLQSPTTKCCATNNNNSNSSYNCEFVNKGGRLIVISLDGFRYDYLTADLTPNLYAMATRDGVTGHMVSTFTTKTFPNHQSIATGCYQETHGIVNNVMFDPTLNERFLHRTAEQQSNHWFDDTRALPLYIVNQLYESGRASCCSPWIGCHASYRGKRAKHYRRYNESADWYEQVEWTLERMRVDHPERANLAMLYIPQPDMISHSMGPHDLTTLQMVRRLDRFVGYVRTRLEQVFPQTGTNLIILSDHGIAQISPDRVLVLDSLLNRIWYDAYGTSPVTTIQPKPGFEKVVEDALEQAVLLTKGAVRVHSKRSLPDRYRYRHPSRVHSFILEASDGWSLFESHQEAEANRDKRGQHGYDNLYDSMRPLFVAVGPAFRRGYRHPTRFVNVDLYPLMCLVLGIPPDMFYHEGNLQSVRDLLAIDSLPIPLTAGTKQHTKTKSGYCAAPAAASAVPPPPLSSPAKQKQAQRVEGQ